MRRKSVTFSIVLVFLLTLVISSSLTNILVEGDTPIPNPSVAANWLRSAQNLGLSFQSMDTVYHRILALYFLGGLNQLAPSNKTLLINYIASTYNATAGGYGNWPSSAPSIESTYQAIQTLKAFNSLPTTNSAKIAQFISSLQQSNGGFKALASSANPDVGSTYRAIHTVLVLRGNANDINLTAALSFLTSSQNLDGGFGQASGAPSQLVYTFRAVYAYNLTSNSPPNINSIISFIKSLRQPDNGWADVSGGRTSVGHTYDAVHALDILNQIQPGALDSTTASKATSFITQSQVSLSGFGTHPLTKIPEFTSTHFASQALQLLKRYTTVTYDVNSAIQFSLNGPPPDGGFADFPGGTTDLPDTYYAAIALHFLGSAPVDSNQAVAFAKNSYVTLQGGFGFRPASGAIVKNTYFGIQTLRFFGVQRNWTEVISFLQSAQNPDGGFGASPGNSSSILSTSFAVLALQQLNVGPSNPAGAVTYLESAHNSNGGFGVIPGSASDIESTMQAILALKALGQSLSSVSNALTFVANTRNLDGGYGFNPGNISRIDYTHDALLTYIAFRSSMPNNSTTTSLVLARQNPDGGFGLQTGFTSDVKSTFEAIDTITMFNMISSGSWATPDIYAPVIDRLLAPAIAPPGAIPLSARVTDNETGVANVTLYYSVDAIHFQSQTLAGSPTNTYSWSIGPYSAGTLVTYRMSAYDNAGNKASTQLHTVQVQSLTPTFPSALLLMTLLLAVASLSQVLDKKRRHG